VAPGDIGALLCQEGIYSSHLATWRKQRQASGETGALARRRGPKTDSAAAHERHVFELEKQVERLQAKVIKADLIVDVRKTFNSAVPEHRRHAERAAVISAGGHSRPIARRRALRGVSAYHVPPAARLRRGARAPSHCGGILPLYRQRDRIPQYCFM
jgi:hypothetical protein